MTTKREDSAEQGRDVLNSYPYGSYRNDPDCTLTDLLTDLRHAVEQDAKYGILPEDAFDNAVASSLMHFEAEGGNGCTPDDLAEVSD